MIWRGLAADTTVRTFVGDGFAVDDMAVNTDDDELVKMDVVAGVEMVVVAATVYDVAVGCFILVTVFIVGRALIVADDVNTCGLIIKLCC